MVSRARGVHIIGDLHDCQLNRFALNEGDFDIFKLELKSRISESGLVQLGAVFHYFGPSAVTGVVCLSTSHLSFHTWPESGYVSFDLFTCLNAETVPQRVKLLVDWFVEKVFISQSPQLRNISR